MKKMIVVLSLVTTLIFGYVGYLIYSDMKATETGKNSDGNSFTEVEEMRETTGGTITDEDMQSFKEKGLNPFGQQTTLEQLTDTDYQEYIHGMSHQKVQAEQKWGFYHINSERIDWLLDGLNNTELSHSNVYRQILEKWANGDFQTADNDHNAIWELQGGTIGRATGVLSSEEEKKYIESQ